MTMNTEAHDPTPDPQACSSKGLRETLDELSQSLTEAILKGARDARRQAEEGLPKLKSDLSKGAHHLAYTLAYVGAFGGAIAKEILPETMKAGWQEGRDPGKRAAEDAIRRRHESKEAESPEESSDAEGAWV